MKAHHLLFFCLDFETRIGRTVYNGPERYVRELLPEAFRNQRLIGLKSISAANAKVKPAERLKRI